MIDRYDVNICDCELGAHTEAVKDLNGEWIRYESFKTFLIVQTCLDYFRTSEKSEKWLDENGTELISLELNSIKEVKDAIVTINQRKNNAINN